MNKSNNHLNARNGLPLPSLRPSTSSPFVPLSLIQSASHYIHTCNKMFWLLCNLRCEYIHLHSGCMYVVVGVDALPYSYCHFTMQKPCQTIGWLYAKQMAVRWKQRATASIDKNETKKRRSSFFCKRWNEYALHWYSFNVYDSSGKPVTSGLSSEVAGWEDGYTNATRYGEWIDGRMDGWLKLFCIIKRS